MQRRRTRRQGHEGYSELSLDGYGLLFDGEFERNSLRVDPLVVRSLVRSDSLFSLFSFSHSGIQHRHGRQVHGYLGRNDLLLPSHDDGHGREDGDDDGRVDGDGRVVDGDQDGGVEDEDDGWEDEPHQDRHQVRFSFVLSFDTIFISRSSSLVD